GAVVERYAFADVDVPTLADRALPASFVQRRGVAIWKGQIYSIRGVDLHREARSGGLDLDRLGDDARICIEVQPGAGARGLLERVVVVLLGAPGRVGIAVDDVSDQVVVFGSCPERVVPVGGGLAEGDRLQSRLGVDVGGHTRAAVRSPRGEDERDRDDRA